MGKLISQAGEVDFKTKGVKRKGTQLVIVSVMGLWDAEIHLSIGEVLRMFLNRNIPMIIIALPVALIMGLFERKRN